MVTALGSPRHIMNAFTANCEAYITKPFTDQKIEETLNRLGVYKPHSIVPFEPLHIP